ncbi:DUF2637 domain-containing protein [Streptomyces sp. NBC_00079]|uniref:DUF2637 domain-containing protein n=1 Tax=Streptomyces sp. NBC_00079 TaxID=2975644 RepID=UPI0032474F83
MSEDRITQRTITVVMAVIAVLAFVFSFGNVWNLALRLGVPNPIAPLIAPMVDLSVLGLLVALRYLSLRGVPADDLKGATRLMHTSGFFTLALNIAEPIIAGHYGRACVDAVAPLLLLGWGAVGPALLRHFHAVTTPAPAGVSAGHPAPVALPEPSRQTVPKDGLARSPVAAPHSPVKVAPALLDAAREVADAHRAAHGQPITAPQLKARLGVSLPLATAAHAALTA